MILRQLQQYILTKRIVSLQELSKQFTSTPDVISGMLEHWLRKGVIRKLEPKNDCNLPCQQCRGCTQFNQIFYQAL